MNMLKLGDNKLTRCKIKYKKTIDIEKLIMKKKTLFSLMKTINMKMTKSRQGFQKDSIRVIFFLGQVSKLTTRAYKRWNFVTE